MEEGIGSEGNHFVFSTKGSWAATQDDWSVLAAPPQRGSDGSYFTKTQKLGQVFVKIARGLLDEKTDILPVAREKCVDLLRDFAEQQNDMQGQVDEMLSGKTGVTRLANHLELAYRASYRRVLFCIDQYGVVSGIDYLVVLKAMAAHYPELSHDFPKLEHDIHPFDMLERPAVQQYGLAEVRPSYVKQLKYFCQTRAKYYFPPLVWLPEYQWSRTLVFDLLAGLTVGVFLVPQAMAYALLAGLPIEIGLYSCTIPVLMYALLGTSRQLAAGPFALVALLVNGAIVSLPPAANAAAQVAQNIQASVNLMLYVGLILTVLGIFRMGFISNFISKSFLAGFTSASGIIIQTGQLPGLLGEKVSANFSALSWIEQAIEVVRRLPTIFWPTLLTGLVTLVVVVVLEQLNKNKPIVVRGLTIPIPSALIVIVFGILISYLAGFQQIGIKLVGFIPPGFNKVSIPTFDDFSAQFVNAIIIALVVYLSSAAIAMRYADQHKYVIDSSQEQIALGISNIVGSFLSGFVVCGAMSRSAVANAAGARSGLFGIVTALIVILILLVATPVLFYLPSACLSAMIMVAAYGLWDFMLLIDLWRIRKMDFVVWMVSFLATLFLSASLGLLVALGFSIILVVYRASKPHIAILGRLPRTTVWRSVSRFPDALIISGLLVLRVDADFFFANIRFVHDTIVKLVEAEKSKVHVLLLDLSAVSDVDFSALTQLQQTVKWLQQQQIKLLATAVNGPVRDMLRRSGFLQLIGEENVYWLHADAARVAKELIRQNATVEPMEFEQGPDDYERTFSQYGSSGNSFTHAEKPAKRSESFWNRLI